MLGRNKTILASTALVAALALAACTGDTGPPGQDGQDGQDGLGYVPMPTPDQALGEYDPLGTEEDQTLLATLGSESGVWEIPLDGQVQIDFGNGTPPVVADTVIYDANFDELWLVVDGVETPLTLTEPYESHGCNPGVPEPCVYTWVAIGGDYAELVETEINHGPAVDAEGFAHYGVKTAAADMPHDGTATYVGSSRLIAGYTRPDGTSGYTSQTGAVTISVDFGAVSDQVDFSSTNGDLLTADDHDLSGLATIDGNSYTGTLSGTITGTTATDADTLDVTGTYSGTFYGPAVNDSLASETAGVFAASDTEPDLVDLEATTAVGDAVGGFLADAEEFVPAPPL